MIQKSLLCYLKVEFYIIKYLILLNVRWNSACWTRKSFPGRECKTEPVHQSDFTRKIAIVIYLVNYCKILNTHLLIFLVEAVFFHLTSNFPVNFCIFGLLLKGCHNAILNLNQAPEFSQMAQNHAPILSGTNS